MMNVAAAVSVPSLLPLMKRPANRLVKLLAIPLGCQKTAAKSLVLPRKGRVMLCRYATLALIVQPFESLDTQHRHQQRTPEMRDDDRRPPRILFAQQQRDSLCRKGGKSGQSAEKAGDDEQPPFRRNSRIVRKKSHREADQITADQIGGKRAERQLRQRRIDPQPQAPAQPCAECRADSYRKKSVKHHNFPELVPSFMNSIRVILQHTPARSLPPACGSWWSDPGIAAPQPVALARHRHSSVYRTSAKLALHRPRKRCAHRVRPVSVRHNRRALFHRTPAWSDSRRDTRPCCRSRCSA